MLFRHAGEGFFGGAFDRFGDDIAAQFTLGDFQQLGEDRDIPVVLDHPHGFGKGGVEGRHVEEFLGRQDVDVTGVAAKERPFRLDLFLGEPFDKFLGGGLPFRADIGDDADALTT